MDSLAMFTPEPADDQYKLLSVSFPERAFSASGNIQDPVTVRAMGSLVAPYIKDFSVPALRSRR